MYGCFVTGTDTGVGKTVVAAALCAALRARGDAVTAFKPVVTGIDEPEPGVPTDHELLGACSATDPEQVAPLRFGPAVSPHLAAELAGTPIDRAQTVAAARAAAQRGTLVAEGVGGLLVPMARDFTIRDLAAELGLPLVVVARPGLGTINHTALTVESARAAGLRVAGVVLNPWPGEPSVMERSNAATIAAQCDVPVSFLAHVAALEPGALAAAGAALPLDALLGEA